MANDWPEATLEDRIFAFLETVPLASIERELAMVAPGCEPHRMSVGEVVRTLGVSGVAALAGVRRSTVLESAGPESCAIADLIAPNPFGYLSGASSCRSCQCGPCSGTGYGPHFSGGGRGATVDMTGGPAPQDPGYYRGPDAMPAGGYSRGPEMQLGGYQRIPTSSAAGYDYSTTAAASYDAPAQRTATRTAAADWRRNPPSEGQGEQAPIVEPFIPESGSGQPFTGWPGAVPFRKDAWNFSEGWYILQRDDTFSGLAATYLGSPARWHEIWALQPYRYTKAVDPSSARPDRPLVQIGERVIMPEEATDRARELVSTGAPSAPAIGGVGGTPKGAGAPWSTGAKLAVGAAVLGVLGVGVYAVAGPVRRNPGYPVPPRRRRHRMYDYRTGEFLRSATTEEARRSKRAAKLDGGRGVISVDGRSVYVS